MSEGDDRLTSITEIGVEWGLTNRSLGDMLRNEGYRSDGKPTTKALDEGLAVMRFIGDYPSYSWSPQRVGAFLEALGRKKRTEPDGKPKQLVKVIWV